MPAEMQTFHISNVDRTNNRYTKCINQHNLTFPDIKSFVETFCEDADKLRVIKKVLVATNGIAAVKCILSIRKLLMQLFRDDRIIKFICLTTEQEIESKAEYLKMADNIVFSPAGANTNNYANVDEIVEHAVRNNVDAVWAGWGHASENPRLPEELNQRGIVFIGPPANAMFALGDKIASTIIAQTVNIPTIEWSGKDIYAPSPDPFSSSNEITIPDEIYRKATVTTVEEGLKCMKEKEIPYPVMIKASEGGGGKGIRKCLNEEEFVVNFRRVQAEVPGSPIFLMKCMVNARHIEVQLIADQYGNVIPIYTRDCSIQRRCQKIIEEAPASIASPEVLKNMQQDAVNLAKKVGYVSAGTVEYMYLPETKQYYFLELNPRLQVEHPCTEMISNINIPSVQLQIAMGIPLHRIVDIRLFYGLDRYGTSLLPENEIKTESNICVIAARITSEDPAEGFRPSSGSVKILNFQSNQNVWGYFSVSASGKVHEFADSQFGHLFAKGTTRHEAISALMCALNELELRATFQSQVHYLVGLLRDPEFENNNFHTGWLDARIASKIQNSPEHPLDKTIAIGATIIAHKKITEIFMKFKNSIERGQILPTTDLKETWELELVHNNIKYNVMVNRHGLSNYLIIINNVKTYTYVHKYDDNGALLISYNDDTYQCYLDEEQERYKVTIGQTLTIFEKENDPSLLRSRNAGRLLQYLKKDGEKVEVNDVYAEMESMKMVINLDIKKAGGILVQRARPGQVLYPGTLIAELKDQEDMLNSRPKKFNGIFNDWIENEKNKNDSRLDIKFEKIIESCNNVLNGYSVPDFMLKEYIQNLVNELYEILENERLPFVLYKQIFNVVKSRIKNINTINKINKLLNERNEFCSMELSEIMSNYLDSLNPSDVGMERCYFEKLQVICDKFNNGIKGHKYMIIKELIENYIDTEKYFQNVTYDKAVNEIFNNLSDKNIDEKVRMIYSHTCINIKHLLLEEIIKKFNEESLNELKPTLKFLTHLYNPENEKLAVFICKQLMRINNDDDNITKEENDNDLLELSRLPNDTINISNINKSKCLLYKFNDNGIQRLFLRSLMKIDNKLTEDKFKTKLMNIIDNLCNEIRVYMHNNKTELFDCNHILIKIDSNINEWSSIIKQILEYYQKCFIKLRITEIEVSYQSNENNDQITTYRAIYTNETSAIPEFSLYKLDNGVLKIINNGSPKYDNQKLNKHASINNVGIQKLRMNAQKLNTIYCYDLPIIFGRGILDLWHEYEKNNPKSYKNLLNELPVDIKDSLIKNESSKLCKAYELILKNEDGPITLLKDEKELEKRPLLRDRGMIAWELTLYTPDCPEGRKIVLISNDITYQMGSFSMKEHCLYYHASLYSRKNKLPRIYFAANSGARIGFAQDIKKNFKINWINENKPEEGFDYLYLDDSVKNNEEIIKQIDGKNKNDKMMINAIIGKENDIGVENLVGSGLIAGETSAAYQEVPTYCIVSGRAVGIGAYAARLSHRIVQVEPSHIILTGAPALNSLLGREIYTSNGQLGGTQIMHKNGVSHAVASSDLEGICKVLKWISYLPQSYPENELESNVLKPLLTDDLEREISTYPSKGQYDPRTILDNEDGGLFDKNSLDEIMDNWAKTIISARARICGLPVGVIAVETRTVKYEIPADPASENSQSLKINQAGQVWYPDSAYKTAEAINDFNKEGLPLIFLANIRGFSGGQKDMFEMVLKFGAKIVDALQSYKQPVIVYIPPNGELRGGAWAVLDTNINPTCMKMLADVESRGGVLEPDGIVEIKFRKNDLHALMLKCDSNLQELTKEVELAKTDEEKIEIKKLITKRQEFLYPVYRTVSVKFADLHDTTTRMLAKGAIHDQLNWMEARNYIHQLLKVQLIRLDMARRYAYATGAKYPLTIQDLENGCKNVDEYLKDSECEYLIQNGNFINGQSKYSYNVVEILNKSYEFSRVLEDIAIKQAALSFIEQLKKINSSTRNTILTQFVQLTDNETHQEILDAVKIYES